MLSITLTILGSGLSAFLLLSVPLKPLQITTFCAAFRYDLAAGCGYYSGGLNASLERTSQAGLHGFGLFLYRTDCLRAGRTHAPTELF